MIVWRSFKVLDSPLAQGRWLVISSVVKLMLWVWILLNSRGSDISDFAYHLYVMLRRQRGWRLVLYVLEYKFEITSVVRLLAAAPNIDISLSCRDIHMQRNKPSMLLFIVAELRQQMDKSDFFDWLKEQIMILSCYVAYHCVAGMAWDRLQKLYMQYAYHLNTDNSFSLSACNTILSWTRDAGGVMLLCRILFVGNVTLNTILFATLYMAGNYVSRNQISAHDRRVDLYDHEEECNFVDIETRCDCDCKHITFDLTR